MKKCFISLVMIAALGFSSLSVQATVDTSPNHAESCEHHQAHTLDCGYVPASEATACTHLHEEGCYTGETVCLHTDHDDTCGHRAAWPELPCGHLHDDTCGDGGSQCVHTDHTPDCGYQAAQPELPCRHLCSEENGCVTPKEQCIHTQHDAVCGYAEAVGEIPCTFVCSDCGKTEETVEKQSAGTQPAEKQSIEGQSTEAAAQEESSLFQKEAQKEATLSQNEATVSQNEASVSQNEASALEEGGHDREAESCICTIRCKEGDIEADCVLCSLEEGGVEACKGLEKISSQPVIFALTTPNTIYVSSSGNSLASGTQEYPVNTIEKALEKVNDGGTIQILDSVATIKPEQDEPLRIEKNVTIKGGSLSIITAGIVLGADVTFEGITLNFANSVRNAIVANGYALTLNGVTDGGTYPFHFFCGDIKGYNSTGTLPQSGSNGSVTITGSNSLKGNIYAGSLHEDGLAAAWTGASAITLSPGISGFPGEIYAHGATASTVIGATGMMSNSSSYTVSGAVSVNLTNGIGTVYGKTGGTNNAAISFTDNGNGYPYTPTLYDIGSLSVNTGTTPPTLAPTANSTFSTGAAVTLPANTRLDLTKLGNMTIGSLSGGGTLIMNPTQTLTITGAVSGTTQIAIGSIAWDGTSQETATDGHAYVSAPNSGDNSFALLDSYYDGAQPLNKGSDGSWTAGTPTGGGDTVTITSFSLGNATVTGSAAQGQLSIGVSYNDVNAVQEEFLYSLDRITVQVNSVEAPYRDAEYAYVDDATGLKLFFESDGEHLTVEHSSGTLPVEEYTISVTIPGSITTSGAAITSSGKLTVKAAGHTHSFTYRASGNTITAACSNDDGQCPKVSQTITLTAPGVTIEYDGAAKAASVSGAIDGVAAPAVTYEGSNYPASATAPADVGSYTAFITVGGQRAQVSFAITPKDIAQAGASVGSFDPLTYTGKPQTPKAAVTVGGVAVTGSWSSVTNVGEQSTFTATGNYTGTLTADVGMAKADPTVTAPGAITNLTYTGKPQALVTPGTAVNGKVQYSLDQTGVYTDTIPTGTEAGTYQVWYKVVGNANYGDIAPASVNVTIGKAPQAPLTITSQSAAPVYGDRFTLSASGGSGTGSVTWAITGGGNHATIDAGSGVVQVTGVGGAVTVTAAKAGDTNYQEASAMWTFTPGKKQVAATVAIANKTYDGTAAATVTAQVSADQLIPGDSLTVEGVRGSFPDANVGSGKIVTIDSSTATWKGTNASCYQVTFPTTRAANITKATAAPVAGSLEITNRHAGNYTYDLSKLLAPLTGSGNYGTVEYILGNIHLPNYYTGGATVNKDMLTLPILEVASDKEETVGTITVSMVSQNYDFTGSTTITVKSTNKEVPQGSPVLSANTLTYGELLSKITLTGSMKTAEGTEVAGTFVWDTPDTRFDAGLRQGVWTFTPADTSKYLIVSGISDITVKPAVGQASVTMAGWTYGQTATDPAATTTTNANVTALFSYKKKGEPDSAYTGNKPQDAGTYVVRAVFPATSNYTEAAATAEFTIQGAAQSAPGVVLELSKTYNSITLQTIGNNPLTGARAEYSRDGGATWQTDPVFTGLSASTAYRFTARYAAIGNYAASAHGPVTEIITNARPAADSGGSTGSTGSGTSSGTSSTGSGTSAVSAPKPAKAGTTGNEAVTNVAAAATPVRTRTAGRNTRPQTDTTTDRVSSVPNGTLRAGEKILSIEVQVDEGIARLVLPQKEVLDELIKQAKEEGIILDLTGQQSDVRGAAIPLEMLSAIAEAGEEGISLTLHLPTGGIRLDGAALRSVCGQAECSTLQLVVENVGTKSLNNEQENAVSSMDVREGVEAYIYCTRANKRIGEFEGGMAEIWIPFVIPQGSLAEDFGIYHISENGEKERLNTRYEAEGGAHGTGCLVGDTSHFSDFVVIYEKAQEAAQTVSRQQEAAAPAREAQPEPTEGDSAAISVVPVVIVLLLLLLIGAEIYLANKEKKQA